MTPNAVRMVMSLLCVAVGSADLTQSRGWNFRNLMNSRLRELFQQEYNLVDEGRLAEIERGLAPMYATLPKNSAGRVGHAAAAYALRRHFLRKYGWLVKGLVPESGGSSWDWKSSSPTRALDESVPLRLREVLDDSLRDQGLDLEGLAIMAAMLEVVLVDDSGLFLEEAFRLAQVPVEGQITDAQMTNAFEAFMLIYITTGGKKVVGGSPARFHRFKEKCENRSRAFNPLWQETKAWLRDIERSAAYERRAIDNPFLHGTLTFKNAEHLVGDIHSQYRLVQNGACLSLKHKLLSMEDTRGTGRLSFTKFHNSSVWGATWEFRETKEELTALGALDVSDPAWPRVIIANYVQSNANCLAAHGRHSVCCIDECEAFLAEVERAIGAAAGEPAEIARVVGGLESETMDAPRNVSAVMFGRLQDMAVRHKGLVPLHGRLFAQWMHHAFPNECAHPLPSHWSPPESLVRKGLAEQSPKDLLHESDTEKLVPWSDEDELLEEAPSQVGEWAALLMLSAFFVMSVGTLRSGLLALRRKEGSKDYKHNI